MLFPDAAMARRLERRRDDGQVLYAQSFDRLYPQVGTAIEAIADGHAVFVGRDSQVSRAVGLGADGRVLPQFRNRGAQTAMLRARLAAAQAAGCDLVEVQTNPGSNSQRNVMRFGFQVACTRMVMAREKA